MCESGNCLPDVFNLKMLARALKVSADCLLDVDVERPEEVIETFSVGGAKFEVVERPSTILAGKIIYAKNVESFDSAIEAAANDEMSIYQNVDDAVRPICDIRLSVNFWKEEKERAYGFVREVSTEHQPSGVDVFKMPTSLFIRGYTNRETAQLMAKEECEIWELFAYIRNYFMPSHGFIMAENGAQEMEIFDTSEHRTGYAYMPVIRK